VVVQLFPAIAEKYKFEYPEDKLITLSKAVKRIIGDKARYTDGSGGKVLAGIS
jgi:type I restriction enzyme R subunit